MDGTTPDSMVNRPPLIEVDRMRSVCGLRVPEEFYTVLEFPGPLAGMVRPSDRTPWDRLARAGFRYVVCLTDDVPAYDPSPIETLHSVSLEDLYGGISPTDSTQESERIFEAVDRVVSALRSCDGVIVHCAGGTGRTGTVIGGVLRRFGHATEEVRSYLDRLNRRRGSGWPESAWGSLLLDRIDPE